jgi:hypothetical protein
MTCSTRHRHHYNNHEGTAGCHSNNNQQSPMIHECLEQLNRMLIVLESYCCCFSLSFGNSMNNDATATPSPATDSDVVMKDLAPVLVHMDLQPQNLIFRRNARTDERAIDDDTPDSDSATIFSVLDWEDTAWADPRFELLLLCRKVCANRQQAERIWSEYDTAMIITEEEEVESSNSNCRVHHHEKQNVHSLGPIDPWLQLETVHSVTTILLQSMDLLNGGRNPWETKNDLWGKLQREFVRWDQRHFGN